MGMSPIAGLFLQKVGEASESFSTAPWKEPPNYQIYHENWNQFAISASSPNTHFYYQPDLLIRLFPSVLFILFSELCSSSIIGSSGNDDYDDKHY